MRKKTAHTYKPGSCTSFGKQKGTSRVKNSSVWK